MALKKSFPAPTGAAISSVDSRADLAGLIVRSTAGVPRAGVFPRSTTALVTGKASMAVDIAAFEACVVRSGYPALIANDASASLSLDAAPGSNSRIDLVWVRQKESQSPFADGDDLPAFGFTKGTASASPVADTASVPAGALVLAQVLIPSTATTTLSGGVVITQLHDYTCCAGGVIWFRDTTNQAATTYAEGQLGWLIDTNRLQKTNGSGVWVSLSGSEKIIPTESHSGGTVAVGADGTIAFSGAVASLRWNADKTLLATFRRIRVTIDYEAAVTALHSVQLFDGATIATAGNNYLAEGAIATGGVVSNAANALASAWTDVGNAQRKFHRMTYVIACLAVASETTMGVCGTIYNADQGTKIVLVGVDQGHILDVAYDGMQFNFTYASGSMTAGTIEIIGEF